jgi:Leucine-rich repeat (LRR) protein
MLIDKMNLKNYTKWNKTHLVLIFICTIAVCLQSNKSLAQAVEKEYTTLEDALIDPDKVVRLNLENQSNTLFLKQLFKFKNLEYLNLRNTKIKTLPQEINTLNKLKVLDLGDNYISVLPKKFSELRNLTELYLDHEKDIKLAEDFEILSKMQSLRILHLENNNITKLPKNFNKLNQIEKLYLNDNKLKNVPYELKELKNLKFLDIHHNPIIIPVDVIKKTYGGLKINF